VTSIVTEPFVTDLKEMRGLMLRTIYMKLRWLLAVVGILVLLFFYMGYSKSDMTWFVVGLIYAALIMVLPVILAERGIRSIAKARVGKKPVHLEFTPEECLIIDENKELRTRYKYDELWKYEVVKEGITLWITSRLYILFPRRAFVTEGDFHAATQLLQAGIPANK
jgi:hypothetical protein